MAAMQPTKKAQNLKLYLRPISEKARLSFAKLLLGGVGLLFLLGGLAEFASGQHDGIVFRACTTVLPPIATLVIGYYFADKKR